MKFLMGFAVYFALGFSAIADTWTCDEVDEIAKLGYNGSDSVSIEAANDECEFSIGGASVDGMQPDNSYSWELYRRDMEMLNRDPRQFFEHRFTTLLSNITRGHSRDYRDLINDIDRNSSQLSSLRCDNNDEQSIDRLTISCGVLTVQGGINNWYDFDRVRVQIHRPRLMFRITNSDRQTLLIFLPIFSTN